MLYIISKENLKILQIVQASSYEVNNTIDLSGKTVFVITDIPNFHDGDFIKDEESGFVGIVSSIETVKENVVYKINAAEIETLFDRKIILSNENVINSDGIEDFIAETLYSNFVNSTDTLLNVSYINISASTHTKISAAVETENGIYNMKTYIGNAKEKYGIYLDFVFNGNSLEISISKKELTTLVLDATIEDIITYKETYKVDVVAKVTVLVLDNQEKHNYFLLDDRTITDNIADSNRAKGSIDIVTCQTVAEVYQTALDVFKSNAYQHHIELSLSKSSKIYNLNDFIVGRNIKIKTEDNGIYYTFINSISKKSNSQIYSVVCGNMKITLIEKLKGVLK